MSKVKAARERALQNFMEKNARLILKERRYESTIKKHEKAQRDEQLYK